MVFDAQVQSITQDEIVPYITDQTLLSNVITMTLLANGKPWLGETQKFPIKVLNHTQGGSFDDFGTFNTANENVRQIAEFDPRGYYQSVVIGGIARSVNKISKTGLLNLVKVEMESCGQDMVDDIGGLVYGDGTGNSSKDFLGLDAGIDDGSNVQTYGSIDRSVYTAFKSTIQTSVGAWDFSKARTLWNSATVGNKRPNIAVCNETVFGYIEADYTALSQLTVSTGTAPRYTLTANGFKPAGEGLQGEMGFGALLFDGTPIVRDDKADSGKVYAINTEFFRWYGVTPDDTTPVSLHAMNHKGNGYEDLGGAKSSYGFGWTGFVKPHNQYAYVGQMILLGNLMTNAPRLQSSSAGVSS